MYLLRYSENEAESQILAVTRNDVVKKSMSEDGKRTGYEQARESIGAEKLCEI